MRTPGAERRLAAVLAAEVAGADRERRGRLAALVAARGGRVASAPGDAVLAEFPTAAAALACAGDVQRELALFNAALPEARRMPCRIGVHLGELLADPLGIYGEAVELAARLERACEPGGVLVSAAAREALRGAPLRFAERGGSYALDMGPHGIAPSRRPLSGAAAIALALIAAALAAPELAQRLRAPQEPPEATIAVLPFDNDEAMARDLVAALASFPAVRVQKDAGHARYHLRGSIERDGAEILVRAELVQASGALLWSERYIAEENELAYIREDIVRSALRALAVD